VLGNLLYSVQLNNKHDTLQVHLAPYFTYWCLLPREEHECYCWLLTYMADFHVYQGVTHKKILTCMKHLFFYECKKLLWESNLYCQNDLPNMSLFLGVP